MIAFLENSLLTQFKFLIFNLATNSKKIEEELNAKISEGKNY